MAVYFPQIMAKTGNASSKFDRNVENEIYFCASGIFTFLVQKQLVLDRQQFRGWIAGNRKVMQRLLRIMDHAPQLNSVVSAVCGAIH